MAIAHYVDYDAPINDIIDTFELPELKKQWKTEERSVKERGDEGRQLGKVYPGTIEKPSKVISKNTLPFIGDTHYSDKTASYPFSFQGKQIHVSCTTGLGKTETSKYVSQDILKQSTYRWF